MFKIMVAIMLGVMIYFIVAWAFMMGDTLTRYSVPWLSKTADKLADISNVILFVFIIALFILCTYGAVTDDPSFVGVMK